ncbi:MAG TPA: polysaccharide deacetylase family protein [Solirubrobacteraceae bacterium]|nr:polysaccharide deacetylase family protein [Solirubrobacteraceae bacterium]
MPRWNWDFDGEQRSRRRPTAPATRAALPAPGTPADRARIRRRRAGAGLGLLLVVVIALVIALAPGAHHAHAATPAKLASANPATRAKPRDVDVPNPAAAVKAVLAYTPFVKAGAGRGRDIALTFDDGPGPYTPGVLSVLEHYHVRATFFEVGAMLRYFSASTVREVRDGDVIGDHTETHPFLATLSRHDQREQLFEQIARVELADGPRPLLFRPPYGSYNATTMRELRSLHLLMVLWSVDSEDYLQPGVATIVQRALAGAHPGAIVLMHDAGGTRTQTIEALPIIIRELRARGFHLVTVPQLLQDDPPPAGQPLPSSLSGD